ncbi:MAG: RagB/SusD family nutrient uptake outer membrane protein [Mangrovibacterium sp.]
MDAIKRHIVGAFLLIVLALISSCKEYLDVVPDNVATIDNAFANRTQAEKFLFTCFSFLPLDGDINQDPAMLGGDEIWDVMPSQGGSGRLYLAMGAQSSISPYFGGFWIGSKSLFRGLRNCNIFLENIDKVPDMQETEKRQWISEVKFLKAYYHFYLVRMYGPIPIIKENLPVDAGLDEVKAFRDPVDSCFNYITQLLDEAIDDLPLVITNPIQDLGRITQPIALALKAKVLVFAASPLFNGNTDQENLKNRDETPLFNTTYSGEKWNVAAVACQQAIEICHQAGIKLYQFMNAQEQGLYHLTDTIVTQMSIRNSVCRQWNEEMIWVNTQSRSSTRALQRQASLRWDPLYQDNAAAYGTLGVPLKVAELFYTQNGVPINEDKTWDYANRYRVRASTTDESLYIKKDYLSASFNFNREPRFYADLGFDGGIWYGQGIYDDKASNIFYLQCKRGQMNGKKNQIAFDPTTGIFLKKLVNYQNVITGIQQNFTVVDYPWPIMRLADLYLLYAEALNESQGPGGRSLSVY